jgi:hypothetical protein
MSTTVGPMLPPGMMLSPEGGDIGPVQSGWRLGLREFMKNRLAITGVGLLVFFVLFSFLGPLFYHGDYITSNLLTTNLPPGSGL